MIRNIVDYRDPNEPIGHDYIDFDEPEQYTKHGKLFRPEGEGFPLLENRREFWDSIVQ